MLLYLVLFLVTLAFAANSVVTRLALQSTSIDPVVFSLVRLISGALIFAVLVCLFSKKRGFSLSLQPKQWLSGLALFTYAVCFSLAYTGLESGVGALLLFASVQLTLMVFTYLAGERFSKLEYLGLILCATSMIIVCWPQSSEPVNLSLFSILLMTTAGSAWGVFTFIGRTSVKPVQDTGVSFILSSVVAIALLPFYLTEPLALKGVYYAILSGAVFSAMAYSVWYVILPRLSSGEIISSQLSVPAIAALGGWLWIGESVEYRFLLALLILIIGIVLVFKGKIKN